MKGKLRFVVHEHKAKRAGLHYDLRIEWNNVLRDWAFRKEPPLEPGIKRFGIAQEDHDLFWLDFEGEIEEGYGAGTLRIWDKGFYEVLKESEDSLTLLFQGEKLKGKYVLRKFKNGWLFFKVSDAR